MTDCPPGVDCTADSGSNLVAGVSPVLALAVVAVLARLYSRHLTGQRTNSSDYTVIVGLVISASLTGMIIYSEHQMPNTPLHQYFTPVLTEQL